MNKPNPGVRNHWTKYTSIHQKDKKTPRIGVLHDKSHTVVGYIDDISQTAGALCKWNVDTSQENKTAMKGYSHQPFRILVNSILRTFINIDHQ